MASQARASRSPGSPNIFASPPGQIFEIALRHGCEVKRVRPGAVVLPQGGVAAVLYLLSKGLLRAAMQMKRRKFTLDVFLDGYVFTSTESFIFQSPSAYAIEAITNAEYVELPKSILDRLLETQPHLAHELATHHRLWNMRMTRRLVELMTISPLERYLHFVRERPDLLNRLPQYMIASMLGISPESLSRVRKRLATKTRRLARRS